LHFDVQSLIKKFAKIKKIVYICRVKFKCKRTMKVKIRHREDISTECIYIEVKNKEYQIKECVDGLKIIEISNNKDLNIRPHSGNSIVLVD